MGLGVTLTNRLAQTGVVMVTEQLNLRQERETVEKMQATAPSICTI